MFPLYFAVLAFSFGLATLLNSQLVLHFGMRRLAGSALVIITVISIAFLPISWVFNGHPPLWTLMAYLLLAFFAVGMLFGNLNALAMEKHITDYRLANLITLCS